MSNNGAKTTQQEVSYLLTCTVSCMSLDSNQRLCWAGRSCLLPRQSPSDSLCERISKRQAEVTLPSAGVRRPTAAEVPAGAGGGGGGARALGEPGPSLPEAVNRSCCCDADDALSASLNGSSVASLRSSPEAFPSLDLSPFSTECVHWLSR
jgi:hypothetical protein